MIDKYANKLIQVALKKYNNYKPTVLYSGGKDSTVTNYLVQKNQDSDVIFSNTSLDCRDTYLHVKQMDNVTIINPDIGFYRWIKTNIIPTRFSRGGD